MVTGGHLEFMQIRKFAQSCRLGNQFKFDIEPHANTNPSKNFIRKHISSFPKYQTDYLLTTQHQDFNMTPLIVLLLTTQHQDFIMTPLIALLLTRQHQDFIMLTTHHDFNMTPLIALLLTTQHQDFNMTPMIALC